MPPLVVHLFYRKDCLGLQADTQQAVEKTPAGVLIPAFVLGFEKNSDLDIFLQLVVSLIGSGTPA